MSDYSIGYKLKTEWNNNIFVGVNIVIKLKGDYIFCDEDDTLKVIDSTFPPIKLKAVNASRQITNLRNWMWPNEHWGLHSTFVEWNTKYIKRLFQDTF